jgi:hypothetical protein
MLNIFFDIKEIVHKELVLAGQTAKSTYYWDALRCLRENVRRLRLELWRLKNSLLHDDNAPSHTFFCTREFLTRNNMTVVPHPLDSSLFRRLKTKLEGRHFDTIEAIEAES